MITGNVYRKLAFQIYFFSYGKEFSYQCYKVKFVIKYVKLSNANKSSMYALINDIFIKNIDV